MLLARAIWESSKAVENLQCVMCICYNYRIQREICVKYLELWESLSALVRREQWRRIILYTASDMASLVNLNSDEETCTTLCFAMRKVAPDCITWGPALAFEVLNETFESFLFVAELYNRLHDLTSSETHLFLARQQWRFHSEYIHLCTNVE